MTLYLLSSKRSEYSSKPWPSPHLDSSTQAPTKAPVAQPAASRRRSARVVRASSRKKPPLSEFFATPRATMLLPTFFLYCFGNSSNACGCCLAAQASCEVS